MPSFKGQRVFILGDSLSVSSRGTPGAELSYLIRQAGGVTQVAARGGFAMSYFRDAIRLHNPDWGKTAQEMIAAAKAFQPTLVLVLLGTNDYGQQSLSIASGVRQLIRQISGVPLLFLGPPQVKEGLFKYKLDVRSNMARVDRTIKAAATNFISTFPLSEDLTSSPYKSSDGIHFTRKGADIYASRMFYAVQNKLSGQADVSGALSGRTIVTMAAFIFVAMKIDEWRRKL